MSTQETCTKSEVSVGSLEQRGIAPPTSGGIALTTETYQAALEEGRKASARVREEFAKMRNLPPEHYQVRCR